VSAVPPAIPALRRRLLLSQLVLRWGERRGQDPLLPGKPPPSQGASLAFSTARRRMALLSTASMILVPENLAEHWRIVHRFLEILPQHWPGILAAEGALDPASGVNRLLERPGHNLAPFASHKPGHRRGD